MNLGMVAAIAYGVFILLGGIFGYLKAKSKASLISGLSAGSALVASGILYLQGWQIGLLLALIIASILILIFTIRLLKTRQLIPSGLLLLAGVATAGAIVSSIMLS
jgi:uncharacterized membrane protein (UPF0136 family)